MLLISWMEIIFGNRAISAAGPRVWNYLLTDHGQTDIQPFQRVVKDVFIWEVGPKRSVDPPFNCTLEIHLLSYLLYLQAAA